MTDHARFADDLKAYADGELSPARAWAVRRHLARCPACREEISLMTQVTEELKSEPDAPLNAGLRARLLNDPALGTGTSVAPRRAASRPRLPLKWGLAGAALLAWLVLFPLFQKSRGGAPSADRRMASAPAAPRPATEKAMRPTEAMPPPPTGAAAPAAPSGPVSSTAYGARLGGPPPVSHGGANGLGVGAFTDTAGAASRKVHKEATMTVQLANPEAASDTVETMVKTTGGFVASNTLDTSQDGLKTAELVVKVPVTQFETFLGQVGRLGSVQAKNVTGEDITEKASDADSEENVLEGDVTHAEDRLKALGGRAKWRDEQSVRDLRVQLAQSRARLILLKRMAALSTVTIDLTQPPKKAAAAPVGVGFLGGLRDTTRDAVQSLSGSLAALAALAVWLLAYAPLWIPLLLAARYGMREHRRREAA